MDQPKEERRDRNIRGGTCPKRQSGNFRRTNKQDRYMHQENRDQTQFELSAECYNSECIIGHTLYQLSTQQPKASMII